MAPLNLFLEMEIGITGGEEDGVNNEDVDPSKLYTTPEQVQAVYSALSAVGPMFSVAAAFGNVHGVYKPGNVQLSPEKLGEHQAYVKKQTGSSLDKPIYLVMHGGSGSTEAEIAEAVRNGVVKMNIDTDTQWAYWDGLRKFEAKNREYLQGQIGNPKGADKPNKSFYDPRKFVREAELSMTSRVEVAFSKLGSVGSCGDAYATLNQGLPPAKAWSFLEAAAAPSAPNSGPLATAAPYIVGVLVGFVFAKNFN